MKTSTLLVCLAASALAPALRADLETDRRIENAASSSFNYRTVLQGHVKVDAKDGIATLTGTVPDDGQKALAAGHRGCVAWRHPRGQSDQGRAAGARAQR